MQGDNPHFFEKSCLDVLRSFGKAISQIGLYNRPDHPSVTTQLQEMADKLSALLRTEPTLIFVIMGDQVLVNGRLVGPYSQVPANVQTFFMRNKLQSITFRPGFSVEDIGVLCAVAISRPGSGAKSPAQALVEKGVRTIGLNEAEIAVLAKGQKIGGGGTKDASGDETAGTAGGGAGGGIGDRTGSGGAAGGGTGTDGSVGKGKNDANAQFVRTQFGRYMAPELVEKLAAAPQALQLGGESRVITVMFADVRGFTTISEGLTPQETTRFINSFLTPMTRIILDHEGFIDKYIGDAVMAFWNAPLPDEKHADRACAAALAMRERLAALNLAWMGEAQSRGVEFKPVKMGIGINTGPCCVGNVGSDQRFEYSAVGNSVNLASRLEGQSKVYGVDIVMGEETRAKNPDVAALELDVVRVKGKSQSERLFGLLGDREIAKSEEFQRLAALHASFLKAYRGQQWTEAERILGACLATGFPLTGFCELYRARIGLFRRHPPPPDWDGSIGDRRK